MGKFSARMGPPETPGSMDPAGGVFPLEPTYEVVK